LSPSTESSGAETLRPTGAPNDPRPTFLAIVIAHQAVIAAERAATVRDARRARAARRAGDAVTAALVKLERLVLADRATCAAERARDEPLPVPGTTTPVERAWILGWHLLAAVARVHGGASAAGRPSFGERETADAIALIRNALSEFELLLASDRRIELRPTLTPAVLTLDAQLRLFAPALSGS
jgi:hypothetical protein